VKCHKNSLHAAQNARVNGYTGLSQISLPREPKPSQFLPMHPLLFSTLLLFADEAQKPAIMRMDGATRAKVLAAMAGLIILGFLMIALTWLGARMTRRYMGPKLKPLSSAPARDEEWAGTPPEEKPRNKKD
jgi:hypothetical protein